MEKELGKMIALVTGGNRGIGLGVCKHLAKKGLKVIGTTREESKGEAAKKKLAIEGVDVNFEVLDVREKDSVDNLYKSVMEKYGSVDILINNAGIYPQDKLLTCNIECFNDAIKTHMVGPLMLCQLFIPHMMSKGYGRVVNVSSENGQINADYGCPVYDLSKLAENMLTMRLGREVDGIKVKVNSCCPGWVDTDMCPGAPLTVSQAAHHVSYVALLPADAPNAKFFRNYKVANW